MTKNLAPKYNHLDVEQSKYAFWYSKIVQAQYNQINDIRSLFHHQT